MLDEKFYTTEQVANILQVHPFTILKFIKQGKLKGIKLGRVYRIQESDVQKFLEERMTQPGKKSEKKQEPKVEQKEVEVKQEIPKEKPSNVSDQGDHYYII